MLTDGWLHRKKLDLRTSSSATEAGAPPLAALALLLDEGRIAAMTAEAGVGTLVALVGALVAGGRDRGERSTWPCRARRHCSGWPLHVS